MTQRGSGSQESRCRKDDDDADTCVWVVRQDDVLHLVKHNSIHYLVCHKTSVCGPEERGEDDGSLLPWLCFRGGVLGGHLPLHLRKGAFCERLSCEVVTTRQVFGGPRCQCRCQTASVSLLSGGPRDLKGSPSATGSRLSVSSFLLSREGYWYLVFPVRPIVSEPFPCSYFSVLHGKPERKYSNTFFSERSPAWGSARRGHLSQ